MAEDGQKEQGTTVVGMPTTCDHKFLKYRTSETPFPAI